MKCDEFCRIYNTEPKISILHIDDTMSIYPTEIRAENGRLLCLLNNKLIASLDINVSEIWFKSALDIYTLEKPDTEVPSNNQAKQ